MEWETKLQLKYVRLVRLGENLIDNIWADRPSESSAQIKVHPLEYAGEKWQSKIKTLREQLKADNCDAMIVTSLTEIAYLLNLRGEDFRYTPVFKVRSVSNNLLSTYLWYPFLSFYSLLEGISSGDSDGIIFVCQSRKSWHWYWPTFEQSFATMRHRMCSVIKKLIFLI